MHSLNNLGETTCGSHRSSREVISPAEGFTLNWPVGVEEVAGPGVQRGDPDEVWHSQPFVVVRARSGGSIRGGEGEGAMGRESWVRMVLGDGPPDPDRRCRRAR